MIEIKEKNLSKELKNVKQLQETFKSAILGVDTRKTIDEKQKELLELSTQIESAVDIFGFDITKAKQIIAKVNDTENKQNEPYDYYELPSAFDDMQGIV
jgi:hypothetical protein